MLERTSRSLVYFSFVRNKGPENSGLNTLRSRRTRQRSSDFLTELFIQHQDADLIIKGYLEV